MEIYCKILSNDELTFQVFEKFILDTPFFRLVENYKFIEDEHLLFIDVDSLNFDLLEKFLTANSVVLIISSNYTSVILSEIFPSIIQYKSKIIKKNISYCKFLEVVEFAIEELNP